MSTELSHYIGRVAPATAALFVFLFCVPRTATPLRIFTFILLFNLFRDAMTPEGLWKITSSLEIRFIEQPVTLWFMAASSVILVVLSHFVVSSLSNPSIWVKNSVTTSSVAGLVCGGLIAFLPHLFGVLTRRPKLVEVHGIGLLGSIAALAFLGNMLEEAIFRGHLQNYFHELKLPIHRVILLSGLAFAVCHSFLDFTATSTGWPILFFTFYEGIICAYLREKKGLLSAAIAHGMGIFLMSSGYFG